MPPSSYLYMFFIFTHLYHTILSYLTNNIPSISPKNWHPRIPNRPPNRQPVHSLKKRFGIPPATETIPTRLVLNFMSWSNFVIPPPMLGPMGPGWRGLGWLDAQAESWLANWIAWYVWWYPNLLESGGCEHYVFCKRWFKKYCICFCFSDHISSSSQVLNCAMFPHYQGGWNHFA